MRKENHGIDTFDYEISHQELIGNSAPCLQTAIRLTFQGQCRVWLREVYWTLIKEDTMEGIIGTLEFYAPVLVLGVVIIGIVYFMKKRNDKK